MDTTLSKLPTSLRLTSPVEVKLEDGEAGKARKFRMGPAYSGKPVRAWFGRMVVDLKGMSVPAGRMPILEQHDPSRRAGFSTKIKKGSSLDVEGELLDNEVGGGIAKDAEGGFPFQSSIGFDIDRREWLEDGDSKTVNEHEFVGPGLVVTKSTLKETSVVALGADGSTETQVFAWGDRGHLAAFDPHAGQLAEEQDMTPTEFAKKFPAAVAEWKREGATEARAELGAMIAELPARCGFVAEQFAAGATVEAIKCAAALAAKADADAAEAAKQAELASSEKAEADAKLAVAEGKIGRLKSQPGVEFGANEDDDLPAGELGAKSELEQTEQQAKERFAKSSKLQAEFAGREGAYLAWLRKAKRDARVA